MSIEVRGNLPAIQQGVGSKFDYDVVPLPSIPGPQWPAGHPDWWRKRGLDHNPAESRNTTDAIAFLKYLFLPGRSGGSREDIRCRAGGGFVERSEGALGGHRRGGPAKQRRVRARRPTRRRSRPRHRAGSSRFRIPRFPNAVQEVTPERQEHRRCVREPPASR